MSGSNGTGKSTVISYLIEQFQHFGIPSLIYDFKGSLMERFYTPNKCILLNPFDERSHYWDFSELITLRTDYKALAGAIVPDTNIPKDKFFHDAARQVLTGVMHYCDAANIRLDYESLWYLLNENTAMLMDRLAQVGSAGLQYLDAGDGLQTQGVKSTLMQFCGGFEHMIHIKDKPSFSLLNWLYGRKHRGATLFLPCDINLRDELKSFFTLFINAFARQLLALPDNDQRSFAIFLDELPTLYPLDAVVHLLSVARSKGAIVILGFQGLSQLRTCYGQEGGRTIIDNCNNHLIFRSNEPDAAGMFSKKLGERETVRMTATVNSSEVWKGHQSDSYSEQIEQRQLVLPAELLNLPDYHFYYKTPDLPVTRSVTLKRHHPVIAQSFVLNRDFLISFPESPNGQK